MGVEFEEVQIEGNGNEKKKEIVVQIDFFSLDSNWTPLTLYRSNNFSHDQIFNLYYQNLVNRKCRWIKSLMRRSQSKVAIFKQYSLGRSEQVSTLAIGV
jgi:hypothetical protein